MGRELITAPTEDPISLAELQDQIRSDVDEEEGELLLKISAATRWCERFCRRQFVIATYKETRDAFSDPMELHPSPLGSVTQIQYLDGDGNQQVLATSVYDVDATRDPGLIRLAYQESWPTIRNVWNAVEITYTAGYGVATDVPNDIRQAILLLAAHLYYHPSDVETLERGQTLASLPFGVKSLLWPSRVLAA